MNGESNPVASAFASIVLPVPARRGRARRARARRRASRTARRTARSRRRGGPLPRLDLSADVVELDARLRVTRLEGLELREVHQEGRAEQDHEVEDQEDRQHDQERQDLDEHRGVEEPPAEEGDGPAEETRPEREAPERGASAGDDVLFAELRAVDTEEARPRNRAVEREVDEAARRDDERKGAEQCRVENDQRRCCVSETKTGRRHERDDRRRSRQPVEPRARDPRLTPCTNPVSGASAVATVKVYAGRVAGQMLARR